MNLKRFPKNDYNHKKSSFHEEENGVEFSIPELTPKESLNYTAPKPIPPRKGKKLVAMAVVAAFSYGAYNVWNTYARYESYGVVSANVVGVFSPYEGNLSELLVKEGMSVQSGDVVATIVNFDIQNELKRVMDEIQITKSEIESRQSELSWRNSANHETFYKAEGEMLTIEGSLHEQKAQLVLLSANYKRMSILQKDGAVSRHELDRAKAELESTKALISGREKTLVSMKQRIEKSRSLIEDDGTEQMKPLLSKLVYLENEYARLSEKVTQGQVRSPISGVVSTINAFAGERVNGHRLFDIIENDTTKLVLYYDPAAKLPSIGQNLNVWSHSMGQKVPVIVDAISRDTTIAPNHIRKYYSADAQLIRVFLSVNDNTNDFIVGSVIKQPNVIDNIINLKTVTNWIVGNGAQATEKE